MDTNQSAKGQLFGQACLLLYDGECRLCVSAKEKLDQLRVGQTGTGVRFITYQSQEAKMTLGRDYHPGRPHAAYLIRPSGEVVQGLEAFSPLIPILPGGKFLLWWLRFSSVKRLAEWGYRMVARHRYRWFGEAEPSSR